MPTSCSSLFLVWTAGGMSGAGAQSQFVGTDFPPSPRPETATEPQIHGYVGMWVTEDGRTRHELLDNGRHEVAPGSRESACQERYDVIGHTIQYWDDAGFYADGQFRDGVLYHAGMAFHRRDDIAR
jgi:hypothetical protein